MTRRAGGPGGGHPIGGPTRYRPEPYVIRVFYLWFLIGIVMGLGARLFLPERLRLGVMLEMTLGMVGAFAGGLALAAFLGSWAEFDAWTMLGAAAGAVGLTLATGMLLGGEGGTGAPFRD